MKKVMEILDAAREYYKESGMICGDDGIDMFVAGARWMEKNIEDESVKSLVSDRDIPKQCVKAFLFTHYLEELRKDRKA